MSEERRRLSGIAAALRKAARWLVEDLMLSLCCSPILHSNRWTGDWAGGAYQWVGAQWLWPLLEESDVPV